MTNIEPISDKEIDRIFLCATMQMQSSPKGMSENYSDETYLSMIARIRIQDAEIERLKIDLNKLKGN